MWRTRTPAVFLLGLCVLAATTDVVFRKRGQRMAARYPERAYLSRDEMVTLQRLEKLLEQLQDADVETRITLWPQVEGLLEWMRRHSPILDSSEPYRAFLRRYGAVAPGMRSLILKHQYSQGQAIVARMRSARAEIVADWKRLEKHARAMVQTDERFGQPASKLLEEADPLVSRAPLSSGR